jgi:hypothetical protein
MTLVHEGLEWKDFSKPADTYLSPIPGVDAEVPYIVRGINIVDESVLYEIPDKTAIKGKNITETANDLIANGYEIVGQAEKTITITDDPSTNVFEFYYQPIAPSPSIDPTEEPSGEPTEEPTGEPTEEPTESPPVTESPLPDLPPPPIMP